MSDVSNSEVKDTSPWMTAMKLAASVAPREVQRLAQIAEFDPDPRNRIVASKTLIDLGLGKPLDIDEMRALHSVEEKKSALYMPVKHMASFVSAVQEKTNASIERWLKHAWDAGILQQYVTKFENEERERQEREPKVIPFAHTGEIVEEQ